MKYNIPVEKLSEFEQFASGVVTPADLDEYDRWLAGEPEQPEQEYVDHDRGFAMDTVSRAARGVVGLGEAVAGMARMTDFDPERDDALVPKAGKYWSDKLAAARENFDILKPDLAEAKGEEGFLKRGLGGTAESIAPSLAPLAGGIAGAKLGAMAGAPFGPPGALIGGTIGGIAGGTATLFGTFFMGEYQNAYDEAKQSLKSRGITGDEARKKASRHALISASAEAGGELIGDVASVAFFGVFGGQAVKQPLKKTIKQIISGTGFLKALAKAIPFEAGSEVGTAYFQAKSANEVGISDVTPQEAMAEAVLPAIFMSVIFGFAAHKIGTRRARKLGEDLNSGDVETRIAAVKTIARQLDKKTAEQFKAKAKFFIDNGKEIPLSRTLADFAAQKTAEDQAAEPNAPNIVEGMVDDPDGPVRAPTIDVLSPGRTIDDTLSDLDKAADESGAQTVDPARTIKDVADEIETADPLSEEQDAANDEFLDRTINGERLDAVEPIDLVDQVDPLAAAEGADRGTRVAPSRTSPQGASEVQAVSEGQGATGVNKPIETADRRLAPSVGEAMTDEVEDISDLSPASNEFKRFASDYGMTRRGASHVKAAQIRGESITLQEAEDRASADARRRKAERDRAFGKGAADESEGMGEAVEGGETPVGATKEPPLAMTRADVEKAIANGEKVPPSTLARYPDLGKPEYTPEELAPVKVNMTVISKETGRTHEIEVPAAEALADLSSQAESYKSFLECIG